MARTKKSPVPKRTSPPRRPSTSARTTRSNEWLWLVLVLDRTCDALLQALEQASSDESFLLGMGSITAEDIGEESSEGKAQLETLVQTLQTVTAKLLAKSELPELFDELVAEGSQLAWRLSPFKTLTPALDEGFPEAGYDDILALASTVEKLSLFLVKRGVLPERMKALAKSVPGWASDVVTGGEGSATPEYEDLCEWAEAPLAAQVREKTSTVGGDTGGVADPPGEEESPDEDQTDERNGS